MSILNNGLMTKEVANSVGTILSTNGIPSPNRVIIAVTNGEYKSTGGIIIPGNIQKDGVAKKGVVVQLGAMDEEYKGFKPSIGSIVTYGDYAGKRIEPEVSLGEAGEQYNFHCLSYSEIIYVENNNK